MNTTNQEQIDYWDKRAGPTWVELQERLDALLEPLSAAGLQAADVQSGERVLDVGCGCGDTSIALQGLGADVLGVDVSGPMLEHARKRDSSVQYRQADAASTDFGGAFDLVFSRFGVMFFSHLGPTLGCPWPGVPSHPFCLRPMALATRARQAPLPLLTKTTSQKFCRALGLEISVSHLTRPRCGSLTH